MKRVLSIIAVLVFCLISEAQSWQPVEGNIMTRWAKDVTPENAWPQYPRPQLERQDWKNLNGLWEYAIHPAKKGAPTKYEGQILVPYPVESALSGVKRMVQPADKIWYRTAFTIPKEWDQQSILLHFEASDWETEVWINGERVGIHRGGYTPFKFDITPHLEKGENKLEVSVWDPTDTGWQPLGKQVLKPGGIFYTPVTGIWQTVWLEPVNRTHLEMVKLIPDIDREVLVIDARLANTSSKDQIWAKAYFNGKKVAEVKHRAGERIALPVNNPVLWEPGNPNLYDLELEVIRKNKVIDRAKSYFGMRKVSRAKTADGYQRILINNQFVFQNGPLDQGYWPDGIYTPPTEEAMLYDLKVIREMGFNMLRKHVKVESRRYYTWCDRMGLLVWQDMPNGDRKIGPQDPDIARSEESEKQFRYELKQMMDGLYNHPSIVMWVPFNEGWGQFKTAEIVKLVKDYDPSRMVNNASGWTDRKVGDVHDIHNYPEPASPEPEPNRAVVLGEFGGLGLNIPGHMWEETNWGYRNLSSKEELLYRYETFYTDVWRLKDSKGLCAAVYTQITDVESEANGLMTYDRELMKVDPKLLKEINTGNFIVAPEFNPYGGLFNKKDQVAIRAEKGQEVRYTMDGSEPDRSSRLYSGPIVLVKSLTLKAKAYSSSKESRTVTADFKVTTFSRPDYKKAYSPKYRAGGDFALCDGMKGDTFADGKWQGFHGEDLDVTFDLRIAKSMSEISVRFIESQANWIFLPEQVSISVSADGEVYQVVEQFINKMTPSEQDNEIKSFKASLKGQQKIRYIRVFAKNIGHCPEWFQGSGKAWIFADEVEFK
ncbi:MAG: chitobiase/beta-hexosaminidase C-terminal domain-containing protein [Marinilabiliaceae bacterium]|nr:chitobiase/beta-hexosaminidase C-terminal domain-containing protein [Marinilabiliaceae bacterium]